MMRVLVVTSRVPWPLDDGYALRVAELARHCKVDVEFHLATLPERLDGLEALRALGVFRTIELLEPLPPRRSWRRYFRRGGDRHYHRAAYPGHFASSIRRLQSMIDSLNIDVAVAFLARSAEFVRPLTGVTRVVDQYDCGTLTLEREFHEHPSHRWGTRMIRRLKQRRMEATERGLGDGFDLITAISPPDVQRLEEILAGTAPVELVANGVETGLLDLEFDEHRARRAVAFWGDLAFDVNRTAVRHFYDDIWLPYLRDRGVGLAIVGRGAPDDIVAMAERHDDVIAPGFVEDLFGFLAPFPVMVNPMRTGSGLKNKVLEAMAAGKAVVTTSRGVEALPFVGGVHGLVADNPKEFADAVLTLLDRPEQRRGLVANSRRLVAEQYSWSGVSAYWSDLLAKYGGVHMA